MLKTNTKTFVFLLLITVLFFPVKGWSQRPAVVPGDVILQPHFGFPNLRQVAYDIEHQPSNEGIYKRNSYGHFGLSGEALITPRFGIGFNATYSPLNSSTSEISYIYDGNTNESKQVETLYESKENRLRFLIMAYIHFLPDHPNWDMYLTTGMGIYKLFKENKIDGEEQVISAEEEDSFPLSLRVAFGARYFLHDNVALFGETGFGGPLLSFGLSFRIPAKKTDDITP